MLQPLIHLRKYTKPFGSKIAKELANLVKTKPKLDFDDGVQDAMAIWESWEWGDMWTSARMAEVITYLYGCTSLRVPSAWKPLLPESI